MSEFKFACPVCGQHIKCESDKTGTQMECPTCFRKIVVPQAPEGESGKFVLTASQAQSRPTSKVVVHAEPSKDDALPAGKFLIAAFVVLLVAGAAGAGLFLLHGKHPKPPPDQEELEPGSSPVTFQSAVRVPTPRPDDDTNWMLNLEGVVIPDTPASGWISGWRFNWGRATLRAGMPGALELRQGTNGPSEAGVTIRLNARRGEDLAGQSFNIATNRVVAARVTLIWRDDLDQPQKLNYSGNYALRLDFGRAASNRIPVKIYLCTPDDLKSYVAGSFEAEIRNPAPPRPKPPPKQPKRAK